MTELCNLANKYGTDKGPIKHNYTIFYDKYFKKIKNDRLKIFEIGISMGCSAKMWREYFKNSEIYCMDIFEGNHFDNKSIDNIICDLVENGCNVFIGNQTSIEDMDRVLARPKFFDIIIDDGSHKSEHQQISLSYLFKFLNSGGIYFIEDLHTNRTNTDKKFIDYILEYKRIGVLSGKYIDSEYLNENISKIELSSDNKICAIHKK